MDNLLDKILNEKKGQDLSKINVVTILDDLFGDLLERERDILSRRFGLKGDKKETLEKIGGIHKLTRERVRQIETASVKKLKKLEKLEKKIGMLRDIVSQVIEEHGGLIEKGYLLDILSILSTNFDKDKHGRDVHKNRFDFLLSKVLDDYFKKNSDSDKFNTFYTKKDEETKHLEELANDLISKIEELKKTLSTDELLDLLKKLDAYNRHKEKLMAKHGTDISYIFRDEAFPDKAEVINNNKILYSFLTAIKNVERSKLGEWGKHDWQEIKPKTINDKIYLALKNQGEPMHFKEIAEKINEIAFDHKKLTQPLFIMN